MERAPLLRWLAVSVALFTPLSAAGQPFAIDLARTAAGTTEVSVDAGSHTVTFDNLLPGRSYILSIARNRLPLDPLPVTAIPWLNAKPPQSATERAVAEVCPTLRAAVLALLAAKAEVDVPALVANVSTELQKGCADSAAVAAANEAMARTKKQATVSVAAGEQTVVTLQRSAVDDSHPAALWTLTLSGPARGRWLTTYGLSFSQRADKTYFSKAADGGKYRITPERDDRGGSMVPSVYFSWQPNSPGWKGWSLSPTAGFGVTKSSPAVMAGISAIFNENIGLVVAAAMRQELRLAGRYQENELVGENLTTEQLQNKVWRPALVFGVTFRFGSNPFGGDDANDDGGSTTSAAAGDTGKPGENDLKPTPPAKPEQAESTPARKVEGGGDRMPTFSSAGHRLSFTETGDLARASEAERDRLLNATTDATDVFILSHGWWNSTGAADCRYQQIADGLRARLPKELGPAFKPVLVGIYWPSVIFPTETGDCEPAIRTPQGAEAMVQGSFASDLSAWATAAFPAASTTSTFAADCARAVELFGRERQGEKLTRVEAIELATILERWRRASTNADSFSSDGPATEVFGATPTAIADAWLTKDGPQEALSLSNVLNFGNAFTFWTMKARAGVVGSRGVHDLVKAIRARAGNNIRIHLIGHSFGGRLLSAAVVGPTGATQNEVDSLILLEGAFSHFAFSTREQIGGFGFPGSRGGVFEGVAKSSSTPSPAVRGWMVAMFSNGDLANRVLYPMASKIQGSDREAAMVVRWGSIGADGFKGPATTSLRLRGADPAEWAAAFGNTAIRMVNVDASGVVKDHSDLIHDEVFDVIWRAVIATHQHR